MYSSLFKRLLDILISSSVVILLFPVFIIVTAVLSILNRGNAFFIQKRIGKNNKEFKLIKFKSMNDRKDASGILLTDVERLTSLGKFIRKTSIDELPQIINVLKGEMSLIGPRPLLVEYLPYYNEHHIKRHQIRPGITGLAQTKGRNNLTFGQRFDLDVQYVQNVSFSLDLQILTDTIKKVIKPSGDIQLGQSLSELDDIGITKGLGRNYFSKNDISNNEFGSDFHRINLSDFTLEDNRQIDNYQLYADGRHAIQHLLAQKHWERIWLPSYFCYEVVEAIKQSGIELMFYSDAPGQDDNALIQAIDFNEKDVLLRMNYFGLRSFRDNSSLPIAVIEDHSHDLIGNWASKSNADWCIASLRKTIPMAEGGALWSPKQHNLPQNPLLTEENKQLVEKRNEAMKLKRDFLQHHTEDKEVFRKLYIETENAFEKLPISAISEDCQDYLKGFDTHKWYKQKNKNWQILSELKSSKIQILLPENENCNLFSFVFLLQNLEKREMLRTILIKDKLYPVVLWPIPELTKDCGIDISKRMLSIPCDARYNAADMVEIKKRLEKALELLEK